MSRHAKTELYLWDGRTNKERNDSGGCGTPPEGLGGLHTWELGGVHTWGLDESPYMGIGWVLYLGMRWEYIQVYGD